MALDFHVGGERTGLVFTGGSFHSLRLRLAKEIGWRTAPLHGYPEIEAWEGESGHPLAPLLNHSDQHGDLSPDDCATIARALRDHVADWPTDIMKGWALELAEVMERAAENGLPLEFQG